MGKSSSHTHISQPGSICRHTQIHPEELTGALAAHQPLPKSPTGYKETPHTPPCGRKAVGSAEARLETRSPLVYLPLQQQQQHYHAGGLLCMISGGKRVGITNSLWIRSRVKASLLQQHLQVHPAHALEQKSPRVKSGLHSHHCWAVLRNWTLQQPLNKYLGYIGIKKTFDTTSTPTKQQLDPSFSLRPTRYQNLSNPLANETVPRIALQKHSRYSSWQQTNDAVFLYTNPLRGVKWKQASQPNHRATCQNTPTCFFTREQVEFSGGNMDLSIPPQEVFGSAATEFCRTQQHYHVF